MFKKLFCSLIVMLLLSALIAVPAAATSGEEPVEPEMRPMIFVHGMAGSGNQFQTQFKRFSSNGYPDEYLWVFEYDSSNVLGFVLIPTRINTLVNQIKAQTGAEKVDLIGHSLGTMLSQLYLGVSSRAANIAHYINLDGSTASSLPGGVPTLAIWGEGSPSREIGGATNVYFPGQAHTEVVTSKESFVEMYRFLTGVDPVTADIVPEEPEAVTLSGRAVNFPQNTGVTDAVLEIYEVNGKTGQRVSSEPAASYELSGNGGWGPFDADGNKHYEFVIVRPDAKIHHFYMQRFIRSDRFMRLLTAPPGSGLADAMDSSDNHVNLTILRNREWWGDSDRLEINGLNILTAANSPGSNRTIGMFVFDAECDGETNLEPPIDYFFNQPFMTGIDVFIPAAETAGGTVSVTAVQRGSGNIDTINIPNWPSSGHSISLQFNDYAQRVNSWAEYVVSTTPAAGQAPGLEKAPGQNRNP